MAGFEKKYTITAILYFYFTLNNDGGGLGSCLCLLVEYAVCTGGGLLDPR